MIRRMTFVDEARGAELTLPVPPSGYTWTRRSRIETISLDQTGDMSLFSGDAVDSVPIEALLPAQMYPFCVPGAVANPQYYLDWLEARRAAGTVLRFILSGTGINESVLIEEITRSERDGTSDVYASITLRQWRKLETAALAVEGGFAEAERPAETGAAVQRSYTVVSGDCLWAIAEQFYGDGSLYKRLAAANSGVVRSSNLIHPGDVLAIPALENLPPAKADSPSVVLADATEIQFRVETAKAFPELVMNSALSDLEQRALAYIREVSDEDVYWR